jgi:hypothetical protein
MEAQLLAFSHATGIFDLLHSPWGWPVVESLHFIGLSLLVGAVGLFDLRLLGVAQQIPVLALHRLVPFGVAGFALNVTTGVMFVSSVPDQYLYNPAFQSKLMFMALAGVNMLLFYRFAWRGLAAGQGLRLAQIGAAVSLLCWLGVIVCGRLITFFRPPFFWCFWCG